MRTTLDSLYTRYSARLAATAAGRLAELGADPVRDVDDVTQDVWLLAAQLLALPEPDHAWPVLDGLLDEAVAVLEMSRHRELPCGIDLPAARGLPPAQPPAADPVPLTVLTSAAGLAA